MENIGPIVEWILLPNDIYLKRVLRIGGLFEFIMSGRLIFTNTFITEFNPMLENDSNENLSILCKFITF